MRISGPKQGRCWLCGSGALLAALAALAQPDKPGSQQSLLLTISGTVEVSRAGRTTWSAGQTNVSLLVGDKLRTGKDSRATVRQSDLSVLRLGEQTSYELRPPSNAAGKPVIDLKIGSAYFFSRDHPAETQFHTPVATGAIRGTEFNLVVTKDGHTELALLDGQVTLTNDQGAVELNSGEEGVADLGQAPRKSAILNAVNIIQWTLYYPAILDLGDLRLSADSQSALAASLAAYRQGDLLRALAEYPAGRAASDAETVYHAALMLSVGEVEGAERLLREAASEAALAQALRELIATVKGQPFSRAAPRTLPSEWLAGSYSAQAAHDLARALEMARKAAAKSPEFGFAQERVAELEFSFGRVPQALEALDRSLAVSPANAQALALKGFLLSARNRFAEARDSFQRAIAADGALANGWLGRGLIKIRSGDAEGGRRDLETAAALEPNRSFLRSYLGKAFSQEALLSRDPVQRRQWEDRAEAELKLAQKLDPADPTPWLYLALMRHNEYQTAEAIADLDKSKELNQNRQVYRSQLLLDQDQAVRSANLADIYKDADMIQVSLAVASSAVASDYANFSAHLNLASTFDALRDPTRFNLRYESDWFNEQLLAALLAPPGAASLSQNLSQNEYSRLFAANSFGLESTSEFFSSKEYRQTATQFGTAGGTSYALDLDYIDKAGIRVNNALSDIEWYSRVKQQITPEDSLLLLTKYEDYNAGDQFQYYDPSSARPDYQFHEQQTPLLLGGWHHEWDPGSHTLFLAGRLENAQQFSDVAAPQLAEVVNPLGNPNNVVPFDVAYQNRFAVYTAELNQILQRDTHTDVFGIRYQDGLFQAENSFSDPPSGLAPLLTLPEPSSTDARFQRFSAYEYHHWDIVDNLMLIGGLAYDYEQYPANYRRPPLSNDESERKEWSPKAALIWKITPTLTLRAVFSRALGGVSYDESVRLEPTQLAGFDQAFRSIISESLVGSVEAPEYQIAGGALDWRLTSKTWLTVQGQALREQVDNQFGYFAFNFGSIPATGAQAETFQQLLYHENSAIATVNHILADDWFLQAQYQFSYSDLKTTLPDIPATPSFDRVSEVWGGLHQVHLSASWQLPRGWFARGEYAWFSQNLGGSYPQPTGDHFGQVNLYGGYRFHNRRAELTFGVLNLTAADDYHLSPINYYLDLPYQRLFYTRFKFNF